MLSRIKLPAAVLCLALAGAIAGYMTVRLYADNQHEYSQPKSARSELNPDQRQQATNDGTGGNSQISPARKDEPERRADRKPTQVDQWLISINRLTAKFTTSDW